MNSINEQVNYWEKSAEQNWKTAFGLLKMRYYDSCLFFCHLTLEKMLKGLVAKQTGKPAPYLHDLERLAILTKLSFSKEQMKNLRTVSGFSVASRYDDTKFSFYKKCTKNYTKKHFEISKELYLWLKKKYR
ncbi:MAG: HEPN domain-containing protein [Patescibacteria group bacterium]|nr:HEPN domain-containing protein [Patescibacteria group bacterium]